MTEYIVSRVVWATGLSFVFSFVSFVIVGNHQGWTLFIENVVKTFFVLIVFDIILSALGVGADKE
jgi:hypothetical protein